MRQGCPAAAFHITTIHNITPNPHVIAAAQRKRVNADGRNDSEASASRPKAAIAAARVPKAATDCAAWNRMEWSRRSTNQRIRPVTHQPAYANGAATRGESPVELDSIAVVIVS